MLWFLFCFCGSSDGFQRLRNRKYFIFRFDDHHHNKIVAISVIGCVIRMNGVPPRADRESERDRADALGRDEVVVSWPIFFGAPPPPASATTPDIQAEPAGPQNSDKRSGSRSSSAAADPRHEPWFAD